MAAGSKIDPYYVAQPIEVTNRPSALSSDDVLAHPLWYWIKSRSDATLSPSHTAFIERAFCSGLSVHAEKKRGAEKLGKTLEGFGLEAYQELKVATETFLLIHCGSVRKYNPYKDDRDDKACNPAILPPIGEDPTKTNNDDNPKYGEYQGTKGKSTTSLADAGEVNAEDLRLPEVGALNFAELQAALVKYLGEPAHSYITRILQNVFPNGLPPPEKSPFFGGLLGEALDCPCLLELIWSYWHEEGMLVQTLTAIARRFQNMRGGNGRDPLAELEIDPLRPLNNFLWGYIQDEVNRLSVVRRAYEYDHHYGLTLHGKAVPPLRSADSRSKFLEAFHSLLHDTAEFYREDANTNVVADAFPLLNALREVHLLLAQGAHNQFRGLPWAARVEMLIQQWLLSRPEMREFLRGRFSVPYPEPWMGAVDAMKRLQGWSDVSVRHFRDLGVFGERILLSIRYTNWTEINDQGTAKAWARFWKPEIQGYLHAYRGATGVDLTVKTVGQKVDATLPAIHLQRRLEQQAGR